MPNGLSIGLAFPLLAPDGSAAAPSYSFANDTDSGLYRIGADSIGMSVGGNLTVTFGGLNNEILVRGIGSIAHSGSMFSITAPSGDVQIGPYGVAGTMNLTTAGSTRWTVTAAGHMIAGADNTYDIGESGAHRPKIGYFGTNVISPILEVWPLNGASGYTSGHRLTSTAWGAFSLEVGYTDGLYRRVFSANVFTTYIETGSCVFSGNAQLPDGTSGAPVVTFANETTLGLFRTSSANMTCAGNFNVTSTFGVLTGGALRFSGTSDPNASDVFLYRLAAASLRLGFNPSATPTAQTFTIGEASRPGTDTNVGGANGTIRSGLGTGTGTPSSLIFQTPTVVGSGSSVQTYSDVLTLTTSQATFNGTQVTFGNAGAGRSYFNTSIGLVYGSGLQIQWSNNTDAGAGSSDLSLARLAAASVRQGLAPSATPVAQTFTLGEASRPGTDLNVAGSNGTIRSGLGTGNATGSSLIFQTPDPIASSTVAQTYGQRLSLSALGATFDIPDQGLRINNQVNGAGAATGTLTNAPAAGNPNFWLPINIAGTVRYVPCW